MHTGKENGKYTQRITTLTFLSVKRTILINWKICIPDCYNKHNRLKDVLDLLWMESTASTLKDYDNVLGLGLSLENT